MAESEVADMMSSALVWVPLIGGKRRVRASDFCGTMGEVKSIQRREYHVLFADYIGAVGC